jgi:hypothetical protein
MPAVSVTIPGLQSAQYLWRRIESMLGSDTRNSSSLGSQGKLMSLIKPVIKDALNKLGYDIRRTPPERSKIKLLDCVSRELQKIEKLADNVTRSEVLRKPRALSLSGFGLFMLSIPNPDFPKLSAVLPRMAKEEVQIGWRSLSDPYQMYVFLRKRSAGNQK